MSYTKAQFIEDVKAEAVALRQHATKEELERLNIKKLITSSPEFCIYGMCTGHCNNDRAKDLISKCAEHLVYNDTDLEVIGIEKLYSEGRKGYSYLSPIEKYIQQNGSKRDNLIAYLRGETDILDL